MNSTDSTSTWVRAMPAVFVLIWSTGFIVARFGMPHAPPFSFLGVRYALSIFCFSIWIYFAKVKWPQTRQEYLHLGITGILMHAGYLGGVWAAVKAGMGSGLAALIVGGLIGFVALLSIEVLTALDAEGAGAVAGAIVLNIAVWGAMLAYMMQAVSFLILRRKLPNLKRPYVSPWGVPGAVAAAVIAGISFVGYLINPAFQTAIAGIAVIYVVMLIIFAVYGRHNLVMSPEEEYAIKSNNK